MKLRRINYLASSSTLGIVARLFFTFLFVPTAFVASVQGRTIDTNTTIDLRHGSIAIVDGINPPTVVNFLDNARIDCRDDCIAVSVRDSSIFNVFGGTIFGDDGGVEQRQLTDSPEMRVELLGGTVSIVIRDDDTAVMTGPIAYCFDSTL